MQKRGRTSAAENKSPQPTHKKQRKSATRTGGRGHGAAAANVVQTRIKTALLELEEAINSELQNAQQVRVLGVDECVAAVLALNTEEVAEFQRKLMEAVWENKK